MTSLEAFDKIIELCNLYHHWMAKENIDIKTVDNYPIENIRKSLQALELIKEKNIDVYWLKTSPNLSRYNLAVGTNQALKKKEYDLLKEILL